MAIREFDINIGGIKVRCYEGGKGYPVLMLHGSGPGGSSLGSFAKSMPALARSHHILAMDLIGFGRSGRKPREPYFDMKLWVKQAQAGLDRLSRKGPVGIIAHSLSGAIALRLATTNKKIDRVLATGSGGGRFKANRFIKSGWTYPTSEAAFRRGYEKAVADSSALTDAFVKDRMEVLSQGDYGDYFSKMFKGDKQAYVDKMALSHAELRRIKCRVLFVHRMLDVHIPFKTALLPLADRIPQADVIRLANCAHGPFLDQPERFMSIAKSYFG
jgi:2-hydroxymuconate-semialdehyde hydrolase